MAGRWVGGSGGGDGQVMTFIMIDQQVTFFVTVQHHNSFFWVFSECCKTLLSTVALLQSSQTIPL